MAKAILEFYLNDIDDRQAHLRAVKATDLTLLISSFLRQTKKEIEQEFENNTMANEDAYSGAQQVFNKFNELLDEYGINIEELVD
ncbi:MAG TPA: hypothetical protein VLA48_02550 [Nitrososphaeraceae archaeon]|nr:hypothetical protein [Nitrososphaeraceae archaeon]